MCDKKFAPQARTILARSSLPITLKTVQAGKLRRYYGVPLWKQLLDIPTVLLNIRDSFLIGIGLVQSFLLLGKFKPAVVFGKGGFVCLPVGIATHWRKIPLVIHDSDAHPGLTNRVLAKWATAIATGTPLENYNYDRTRSKYVGVPVATQFQPPTPEEQAALKKKYVSDPTHRLVTMVGGGLGAGSLNKAMLAIAPTLVKEGVEVIMVTGTLHGDAVTAELQQVLKDPADQRMYHVEPFVDAEKMADILAAADAVVSRGGATAMAELSALGKATVLVPSPHLTGGQQLKNAKAFEEAGAVVLVEDTKLQKNSTILEHALLWILKNPATQKTLQTHILTFAKPQAAKEVAEMIIEAAGQGRSER